MAHAHVELLRRLDQALATHDFDRVFALHTDDVVAHIRGRNRLSGDHRGIDQFRALFAALVEAAGEYTFENHAYFADDEHGVILQRGTLRRGDDTFVTNEVLIAHIRDDKIYEMWYVPEDQAGLDAWIGE